METTETRTAAALSAEDIARLIPAMVDWLGIRTPAASVLAVPRSLEIEAVQFHLRPDGELVVECSGVGSLTFTPKQAFAILTFMRVPGVGELIEQAEAADEARAWRDYEADPETIAARRTAVT